MVRPNRWGAASRERQGKTPVATGLIPEFFRAAFRSARSTGALNGLHLWGGRDFAVVGLFLPCAQRPPPPRPAAQEPGTPMTRTLVAAFALALSTTSTLSQDYNRESLVRGLCQKDGCDEFTILAADRVKTTDEGTLFKTRLKTFHASYTGRQD